MSALPAGSRPAARRPVGYDRARHGGGIAGSPGDDATSGALARTGVDHDSTGADPAAPTAITHVQVVPDRAQRRARPRVAYAVVAVAGISAVVVAQLLLSVATSQGAYTIDALQSEQTELSRSFASVSEKLESVQSPQNLAANAAALGMVQNNNPVYLRLSDSALLGAPVPATDDAGVISAGNLPNSLLDGVPLVTDPAATNNALPAPAPGAATMAAAGGETTSASDPQTSGPTRSVAPEPGAPTVGSSASAASDVAAAMMTISGGLPTPETH